MSMEWKPVLLMKQMELPFRVKFLLSESVLSFGTSTLGYGHRDVHYAIEEFVSVRLKEYRRILHLFKHYNTNIL